MNITFDRWPGGKKKALTMSYDDGVVQDRKLVGIFNRYGIRGTFHLNSGALGRDGHLRGEELRELFAGHEVSAHSVKHPHLTQVPRERVIREMWEDRDALEQRVGYAVRGMSYPFGTYDRELIETLRSLGVVYARAVQCHHGFSLPGDFMRWEGTCHHNDRLLEHAEQFINLSGWAGQGLMYVWGHSYEFDAGDGWEMIERFCATLGGRDDIWFATNIDIYDYLQAVKSLQCTVRCDRIRNPSAVPVWVSVDGDPIEIQGGTTLVLGD